MHIFPPAIERFWEQVQPEPNTGCWLWTGCLAHENGYARFSVFGRQLQVHRWAYEYFVGPIPEGLHLDHLCRVRSCVNPAHLEPVTNRENALRGISFSAVNAKKTHCVNGHELSGDNLRITRERNGRRGRGCRACNRAMCRKYRQSHALSAKPEETNG